MLACVAIAAVWGMPAGCGRGATGGRPPDAGTGAAPVAASLSRSLIIEGFQLEMEIALLRPPREEGAAAAAGPGSAWLDASVRLRETRGRPLPPELAPEYLWVFHDRGIWSAALVADSSATAPGPGAIERRARGGPSLAAGERVNVVVRVSAPKGESRFVQADRVAVGRGD